MGRFFVGITGASGHAYAEALVRGLVTGGHGVDLCLTRAGALVIRHELGVEAGERGELLADSLEGWLGAEIAAEVKVFLPEEVGAPPSSGTAMGEGAILAPCSMGTLGRVAAGFSSNLVERVADVSLKEKRRLVLVPRETPLSQIHLENMARLASMGATILPAMPGFYHGPKSIDDLVGHVVGKVLDCVGVDHRVSTRWSGLDEPPEEPGTEPLGEG
ncbi:MAG: UbiX family flavin prenyltransferase [Planctomycetes bacterium]|nr:UbiX family flavin prenyltransferase [Planctomycetota bacterium]